MENLQITGVLSAIGYTLYLLTTLYIVNLIANKRLPFSFYKAIDVNNLALAFRRIGMYLGLTIAISSVLGDSIEKMLIDTTMIIIFLFISLYLANYVLLPNVHNDEEIGKKNIAVGLVEFGLFIGTGIIAYASFIDNGGPWYSSLIYFALGQVILISITYFINHKDKIEKGNIAAGIYEASIIIAYSIILKAAIMGPFVSWEKDLTSFGLSLIVGSIMLLLFANKIIDHLFLPTSTIDKEIDLKNYSALLIVGSLKISVAIAIGTVVI